MTDALRFVLDANRCVKCGRCVQDCVAAVFDMSESGPVLARPDDCIGCQHCLAVCPTAAISIFGLAPEDSLPAKGFPNAEAVKRLICCRRSIRNFKDEDIPLELFKDMMKTAWYAPTGVNMQGVHLAVMATRKAMDALRAKVYDRIASELERTGREAEESDELLREFVADWKSSGRDAIFRNAPHMAIASVSPETVCGEADPFITLSYLDLYAASLGVGVVWCGFAMLAFKMCRDESLWREAGVPEGYRPAYAVMMGLPAFPYPRSVQREETKTTYVGV